MRSTFSGFEIVKSGIQSAQLGLDVTGKNISNMGTEGYSRQVLDQKAVYYSSSSYKYAPINNQQIGYGVSDTKVLQIRDKFLDTRFRRANSEHADFAKKTEVLQSINDLLDETTNDGLGVLLEELYERLQVLSLNTDSKDGEFASLVRSTAQKITDTVRFYYNKLEDIGEAESYNLEQNLKVIGSEILKNLTELNKNIQNEELLGNSPNDLYDARNLLLDQLSTYLKIEVEEYPDDSKFKGAYRVKCGDVYLVDPESYDVNTDFENLFKLEKDADGKYKILFGGNELKLEDSKGDPLLCEVNAVLDILNGEGSYVGPDEFKGVPYYLKSLDDFANKFSEVFNGINGADLFEGTGAADFTISKAWIEDVGHLKLSTSAGSGNGKNDNVLRMLNALDDEQTVIGNFKGSFSAFVVTLMADAAIDKNFYTDRTNATDTIVSSIDNQRESIKGVSINEETVNMIKYQRAFEASARVMTALDEMLDIIINRMGVVGR